MAASEPFLCPECNAKLKFGGRAKSRVTCPRCGHQFDYKAPAEVLDPFLDDIDESPSREHAEEPVGSTTAFGQMLQEAAAAPATPARDVDYGEEIEDEPPADAHAEVEQDYGPPPLAKKRRRGPSVLTQKPKKRKKRSRLSADALWMGLGGAGVLALVVFLLFVLCRPGAILGRSLTLEEVAGTYESEDKPGLKITLRNDGTWGIEVQNEGGNFGVDGMVYSVKGRKIICDAPEELKLKPRKRIFIDTPLPLIPQRSPYERLATEFGDFTFKNGMLVSMTKGKFKRVEEPKEEPRDEP